MEQKIRVAVVIGPTASGKTSIAIKLAKRFNGEVVSADSMQIYKYMSIGTAKPTQQEMQGIPHHLIDFVLPSQSFSVADYVKKARSVIEEINQRGALPIIAGGTGLYVSSLLNNIQFHDTCNDYTIRDELYSYCEKNGAESLHNMLRDIDPTAADNIHQNNIPRVIRAIEVYRLTGRTMTQQQQLGRSTPSCYTALKIGLNYRDRQVLYDRINRRVDIMLQNGLLSEAERILSSSYKSTAMQAIGYKELAAYFDGNISLERAVENLKQESRRYAKRQLTWFRRDSEINWFYPDEYDNIQKMQKNIYNSVEKFLDI